MKARDAKGPSSDGDGDGDGLPLVAHALKAAGSDGSEDGTGRVVPIVSVFRAEFSNQGMEHDGITPTVDTRWLAVAFQTRIARYGRGQPKDVTDALTSADGGTHADSKPHVAYGSHVRRLVPTECERLQGFPDGYTQVPFKGKPMADAPRYRMLGNSMAVNVMRWIGERIQQVEEIP